MDLAVDEQGLWALWGDTDNSYRLYAYKIDVYQNAVTHSWTLATGKSLLSLNKIKRRKRKRNESWLQKNM